MPADLTLIQYNPLNAKYNKAIEEAAIRERK